jgi:hypothetical protein
MKIAIDLLLVLFVIINYFAWKQNVAYEVDTSFAPVIYIIVAWILIRIVFRIKKGNWR